MENEYLNALARAPSRPTLIGQLVNTLFNAMSKTKNKDTKTKKGLMDIADP